MKMKKTLAKIIGITISAIIIFQNTQVFALTEQQKLQNQQNANNQKIDDAKKKQEEIEAQKSDTLKAVEDLIDKISDSQDEIDLLESKINDLQAQIKSKERDIEQKEEEYNEQTKLLDARVVAMYETGETSYLDVLLTSTSITDFLSRYYYASELLSYDQKLIKETQDQKAQIEQEKSELESAKNELNTSLAQSEQKSVELKSLKKDKEKYVSQLNAQEKEIQKEIEELESANKQIAKDIEAARKRYEKELEEMRKNGNTTPAGSGYFITPVSGATISCKGYYSDRRFHGGIDYAVSTGSTVKAAADGVVLTTANLSGSYGTYVIIEHPNGLQTIYGHGTYGSICVKPGDKVKQGQKIMLSGNTGNSSGPHLHFEVRKSPYNYSRSATGYGQDSRLNPLNYL